RDYEENIPVSIEKPYPKFTQHFAFNSVFKVKFRPWLKYSIVNKKRRIIPGSSPEFSIGYYNGMGLMQSKLDFQRVEIGIQHNHNLPAGKSISMELSAGHFFRSEKMHF